jgi:diacylglycerol kinase family enzyme
MKTMLALINPRAGGGNALAKWGRVLGELSKKTAGPLETAYTESTEDVEQRVVEALAFGHRRFIAAGGDGTVNAVLGALVRHALPGILPHISLGAVGLGSSNDFHKPVHTRIKGAPCRIDFDAARPHDVGILSYRDPDGTEWSQPWIVNASIGTTAEANYLFNNPDRFLNRLKGASTASAIAYAAAKAALTYRPREMEITLDGFLSSNGHVHNLGIVKNPHFGGSLRYDSPYEPASGRLFVHRLSAVSLPRLAAAMAGLMRGKFMGKRDTKSWEASEVTVRNGGPFAVELDGEIIMARVASFALLPRALRICP